MGVLPIVRLQIQVEPLKQGATPLRWYDASLIREVDRLSITAEGVIGERDGDSRALVDAHHVAHPRSRNNGSDNGLSIGFTSHYRLMRTFFGDHLADGVAGENVLVDVDRRITADDLRGAALHTQDGRTIQFDAVRVAEPCVEFSRFVRQIPPGEAGRAMSEPLAQLRGGLRGFYVTLADSVDLRRGDHIVLAR